MDKFGRNYVLTIYFKDEYGVVQNQVITLPLTIEFDITRHNLSVCPVAQIRIYNLNATSRNQIRYNWSNFSYFKSVKLQAGYGDFDDGGANLPIIYQGNITSASSVREGPNFITTIECYDGGFALSTASNQRTFGPGTSQLDLLTGLMQQLPYVQSGAIGPSFYQDAKTKKPLIYERGTSPEGSVFKRLKEESGNQSGGFFIDQGKAYMLGDNEYIDEGSPFLVDASTGLLNTPVVEETIIHADMLFEPRINVGYQANIQSITNDQYNGQTIIRGVKHRGMISSAVCGEVVTTVEFYINQFSDALIGVVPIANQGAG